MFTQPTPVLSLQSDLRSLSLSSQHHPLWWVSRQASLAGECWSAPILCAGISLLCSLHPCCCTLLHGSEASHPPSPPVKGHPSVWKLFLLQSSLLEVHFLSLFFCLCFFFFLLPYPGTWGFSCLLGSLRSSASFQLVFCRSCSTFRCIFDVFVVRKVISTSYSSTILKVPPCLVYFYIFYFFVEVLTVFLYSSPTFGQPLYDHYFF